MLTVGPYTLRKQQAAAVPLVRDAVTRCLRANKPPRVCVVAPCGFGKTILSSVLMQGSLDKGKQCVFMADQRQLVYQKSDKLTECGIKHAVLMAGEESWRSRAMVVSKDTYVARAHKAARFGRLSPDLVIVDECHRAMSPTYRKLLDDMDAVVIGLTATPTHGNGKGLGDYYNEMVVAASYEELIRERLLVQERVFAPHEYDMSGVKKSGADFAQKHMAAAVDKPQLVGDIVRDYERFAPGRTAVVFTASVAHAYHAAEEFNKRGIPAATVEAKTSPEERSEIYAKLKDGDLRVVCNMAVLTTGVDWPFLSCAIFAFSTLSIVKFLQCGGRVLRTCPGKDDAVIVDHGGNVHRHGFVTDDHDWALDPEETVQDRDFEIRPENTKEREPICCPQCAAMRESGPKCPNCGHQHKRSSRKLKMADGTLKEVKRKKKPTKQKTHHDTMQAAWRRLLGSTAHSNGTCAAAASRFKREFDVWPEQAMMQPEVKREDRQVKVRHVFPGFYRRKK